MAIRYILIPNALTANPDDFSARVLTNNVLEMEEIIDAIVGMGSTVTRADILSVISDLTTAIGKALLAGNRVSLPFGQFALSIQGVFDDLDEVFDPSKHQLTIIVRPGAPLRKMVRTQAELIKEDRAEPRPFPIVYVDLNTNARNSVLTPGGMGQVEGHRLRFDPADPEQGIFFIAEDGTETRVEVVGLNQDGRLMFLIPSTLTAGDYRLVVRVGFGRKGDIIRDGTLQATLTVS